MNKLDRIRVAKPCPASWAEMKGDDKARHCSHCNLTVYNLTAMTRSEAEELIASRRDRLCIRYCRRTDGRVMTSDCPRGIRQVRRRRRLLFCGGLLALFANALGILPKGGGTPATSQETMGKLAYTEPQHIDGTYADPKEAPIMGDLK